MGRGHKNKKRMRNKKDTVEGEKPTAKKIHSEQSDLRCFILRNHHFECFYRMMFRDYNISLEEYRHFLKTAREKLPVVFRVNHNIPNYQTYLDRLKNPKFILENIKTLESASKDNEGPKDNLDDIANNLSFKSIEWFPNKLVWQLNIDKSKLKRNDALEKLHKFIIKASDSGLITRQELVSMIPPLLLDIKPNDIVLDMCAAPGSKTAQMLEMLYSEESNGGPPCRGGVIANDVDLSRANMLIHQLQRMNTSGVMVVNHYGQDFPSLFQTSLDENGQPKESKFLFDKILCDVPCTGDGAIRKLPCKWKQWGPKDGMTLHMLQLNILIRALHLLKIGGLLLYSTCSINPVEDEAVLTEVFRRSDKEAFELLDVHEILPQLKGRRGLSSWKVCEKKSSETTTSKEKPTSDDKVKPEDSADIKNLIETKNKEEYIDEDPEKYLHVYETYEEYLKNPNPDPKSLVRASMFPCDKETMEKKYKIQNAMRILPHDQDSGGFFVALIRKTARFYTGSFTEAKNKKKSEGTKMNLEVKKKEPEIEEKMVVEDQEEEKGNIPLERTNENDEIIEVENVIKQEGLPKQALERVDLFKEIDEKRWGLIKEFYGFSEDFQKGLLVIHKEGEKKIHLISEGIRKIIDNDIKANLNKVNLGSKAFVKNKADFIKDACPFRLCQDSVSTLFPFFNRRKVAVTLKDLKFFIKRRNFRHDEVENEDIRKNLIEMGTGSVVAYLEDKMENGTLFQRDYLVCNNFKNSIQIMCSTELYESFCLRYF